eukprot:1264106-Rhodomonas_salina.4
MAPGEKPNSASEPEIAQPNAWQDFARDLKVLKRAEETSLERRSKHERADGEDRLSGAEEDEEDEEDEKCKEEDEDEDVHDVIRITTVCEQCAVVQVWKRKDLSGLKCL